MIALEHGHARVVAQRERQLAVGDVERDDMRGPALQQAVGEAAGGGADVERVATRDVDAERVERVGELDPAARDELRRRGDVELDVLGDELAGLLRPPPPGAEMHIAGDHRGRGARARREQPSLGEE